MWIPLTEDTPHTKELMLWLKADEGSDHPIGCVVGYYAETDFFTGWVEKSVSGNMNNGLRQDLITHYKELDDGPCES